MASDPGFQEDLDRIRRSWNERARLAPRFFTDLVNHADPIAWERQAESEATIFTDGIPASSLAAARLLEIGCGPARLLSKLALRARAAIGVDISAPMLRLARDQCRGLGNVDLLQTSGGDLGCFRDRSFGLVVLQAVAIHLPLSLIRSYVREAHRVLEPGGRLRMTLNRSSPGVGPQPPPDGDSDPPGSPPGSLRLMSGPGWSGHVFSDLEVEAFLASFPFAWHRTVIFSDRYLGVDAVC